MKYIYTATFAPNENGTKYYCRVPDLPGCITTGNSIDDAIEMITDAASGWLVVEQSVKTSHFLHGWPLWQKNVA